MALPLPGHSYRPIVSPHWHSIHMISISLFIHSISGDAKYSARRRNQGTSVRSVLFRPIKGNTLRVGLIVTRGLSLCVCLQGYESVYICMFMLRQLYRCVQAFDKCSFVLKPCLWATFFNQTRPCMFSSCTASTHIYIYIYMNTCKELQTCYLINKHVIHLF